MTKRHLGLKDDDIKAMEPPAKGRKVITDRHRNAPRGFGVKIWQSGAKIFVLRYKSGGRDRELTIGEYPAWSLTAARRQAVLFRQRIDGGEDVLEERRKERGEPTVDSVVEDYCKAHVDKLTSGKAVRSALEAHFAKPHRGRKLRDVRRRDVITLVESLADSRPRQAGMVLGYIKQVFAWAEDREIIDANPVATLRPQKVDKRLSIRQRGRVLDQDEIASLWARAEDCGLHRLTALALKLVLITGQRPGEVAGMDWTEIDGNVWTIPASRRGKTETDLTVPLTETALQVLNAAREEVSRLSRRRKVKPSGYVFETRAGSSLTVNAIDRAVKRYAENLGNKNMEAWGHWTPHDLRRTCRTGLSAAGVGETVAELVIGHTRKGIAAVYDLHRFDAEKRTALEAWERRLLLIVDGKDPNGSNVVSIHKEAEA